MDCKEFALLLDSSREELTALQRDEMKRHAAQCPDCALMLQLERDICRMENDEVLPESFSQTWRSMIRQEEESMNKEKTAGSHSWKRILATAAAVAFVAGGTAVSTINGWGNGSQTTVQSDSAAMTYRKNAAADYDYDEEVSYAETADASGGTLLAAAAKNYAASEETQAEKIIRTVSFTIRTQQYDDAYEKLSTLVPDYGGTVESLNVSGDQSAGSLRYASLTLRIPQERLDEFIAAAQDMGGMSSYSESSDDVSDSYYDVQSRLDTQKAKLARLLELMESAQTTSDLIEIENAISDAQYLIDSYTGQLNGYDSRVNKSYVYVSIRELSNSEAVGEENTPLGRRIANALKASLEAAGQAAQGCAVFLVAVLPWLAAAGAVTIIVRCIRKKIKKQR